MKDNKPSLPNGVYRPNKLNELGYSYSTIIDSLIKLDKEVFPAITPEHAGDKKTWETIIENFPNDYRLIFREGRMIGYWHAASLKEEVFFEMREGELSDGDLKPEDHERTICPGDYYLYLLCIAVEKEHRTKDTLKELFQSFVNHINTLAEESIFFKGIVANAFTKEGVQLCQTLKMLTVAKHQTRGDIFAADQETLKHWLHIWKSPAFEIYKKKYPQSGVNNKQKEEQFNKKEVRTSERIPRKD